MKNKGGASASTTGSEKKRTIKKKDGGKVEVKQSTVDAAKSRTGAFKLKKYNGKIVTDKRGRITAVKFNDGTVKHATNPVQAKKLSTEAAYDKKKFSEQKRKREVRNKAIRNPIK